MSSRYHSQISATVFLLVALFATVARGDFYARIQVSALDFAGQAPVGGYSYSFGIYRHLYPIVRLDGKAVGYLAGSGRSYRTVPGLELGVRIPQRKKVTGTLHVFLTQPRSRPKWTSFKFSIPADRLTDTPSAKAEFLRAKSDYYARHARMGIPGGHWFKYQALQAFPRRKDLAARQSTNRGLALTMDLVSGRRAVAENLQLDLPLRVSSGGGKGWINLADIRGIRVRSFTWTKKINGRKPRLDPLAGLIPADQYALFSKSRRTLQAALNEANHYTAPLAAVVGLRASIGDMAKFYKHQMGLDLKPLRDLQVNSMAITGGDPYFELGTDLAVLYEIANPKATLQKFRAALRKTYPRLPLIETNISGPATSRMLSVKNDDRSVSCYASVINKTLVVSNSWTQLKRIAQTAARTRPAMKGLEEYHYFRLRYPIGKHSLLVVMTDAAIRKWCGPKWRIANSRRLRAAAELARLTAAHHDSFVTGKGTIGDLNSKLANLKRVGNRLLSPEYGSLQFLSPIVEMDFSWVTQRERNAYVNWRQRYEQRWRNFDPIALQVRQHGKSWTSDLTVMPLINNTTYNLVRQFAGRVQLKPDQGDHHPETLFHVIAAVDLRQLNWGPVGKIGSIEVFLDDDPIWRKLWKRMQSGGLRGLQPDEQLPLCVRISVDPKTPEQAEVIGKLFKSLISPRSSWKKVTRNGLTYETLEKAPYINRCYFSHMSHTIIISFSETVHRRALQRTLGKARQPDARWLGGQLAMRLRPGGVQLLNDLFRHTYIEKQQQDCWDALPILNEWKKRYPAKDPVIVHKQMWHQDLRCPAGGKYVWNAKLGTMESTIFGSPSQPRLPKAMPTPLDRVRRLDFGVTFEDDGLRAKAEVIRR